MKKIKNRFKIQDVFKKQAEKHPSQAQRGAREVSSDFPELSSLFPSC